MKHVVVGAKGQVGRAIVNVLRIKHTVYEIDLDVSDDVPDSVNMLHICIPYDDDFADTVRGYQQRFGTALTVIHSTVPVGTSRELGAVHSPVTGIHPNLERGVLTFTKWFGAEHSTAASWAAQAFEVCGVDTSIVHDPETTEAGKLWQTLQYGILIALQKEAYRYADEVGADPIVMYDLMNSEYNVGYELLDQPYILPIMRNVPGPIGGHCVIPNAKMTDTPFAKLLVALDKAY